MKQVRSRKQKNCRMSFTASYSQQTMTYVFASSVCRCLSLTSSDMPHISQNDPARTEPRGSRRQLLPHSQPIIQT